MAQRRVGGRRGLVGSSTLALAAGLVVLGLSSYAFLGLAARGLDGPAYATLSVLWTLFNVLGPGLFSPIELEVGRAVADRSARGLGSGALLRRTARLVALLAAGLVLLAVLLGGLLVGPLLDGSWLALLALVLTLPGVAAAYLSRGVLAGGQRFRRYGAQLAVEGTVRVGLAALLAVAAVTSAGGYGLLLGVASLAAVAVTLPPRALLLDAGPEAPWSELGRALGWLVLTSVVGQVLVNSGPVVVALSADAGERVLAGTLLAGIVLTRLPLFLFTAVQAVLLPRLADLLGRGLIAEFAVVLRRLLAGVALLGVLGCIGAVLAGPALLRFGFGSRFVLDRGVLLGLAAASGFYMLAVVLNHSLIALQAHRLAAAGWVSGLVAFGAALALVDGLVAQAVWSYLVGCGIACLALAALLLLRLSGTSPEGGPRRSTAVAVAG